MIQNSGDNSAQLAALNEKVKEKEKQIEELQVNVTHLQQEVSESRAQCEALRKGSDELTATFKTAESELQQKLQNLVTRQSFTLTTTGYFKPN